MACTRPKYFISPCLAPHIHILQVFEMSPGPPNSTGWLESLSRLEIQLLAFHCCLFGSATLISWKVSKRPSCLETDFLESGGVPCHSYTIQGDPWNLLLLPECSDPSRENVTLATVLRRRQLRKGRPVVIWHARIQLWDPSKYQPDWQAYHVDPGICQTW